jgi:hypothetical protein
MKASHLMFFNYVAMIGVPVLLGGLAACVLFGAGRTVTVVLLALIGAGCLIYGAVGIREAYIHGGKTRASNDR